MCVALRNAQPLAFLDEHCDSGVDRPKRRLEVVRDRVREALQFLDGLAQRACPPIQRGIEGLDAVPRLEQFAGALRDLTF